MWNVAHWIEQQLHFQAGLCRFFFFFHVVPQVTALSFLNNIIHFRVNKWVLLSQQQVAWNIPQIWHLAQPLASTKDWQEFVKTPAYSKQCPGVSIGGAQQPWKLVVRSPFLSGWQPWKKNLFTHREARSCCSLNLAGHADHQEIGKFSYQSTNKNY